MSSSDRGRDVEEGLVGPAAMTATVAAADPEVEGEGDDGRSGGDARGDMGPSPDIELPLSDSENNSGLGGGVAGTDGSDAAAEPNPPTRRTSRISFSLPGVKGGGAGLGADDGRFSKHAEEAAAVPSGLKRSSLELRKVPTHILLGSLGESYMTRTDDEVSDSSLMDEHDGEEKEGDGGGEGFRWWGMCLRPTYSLRKQMMLTFGLVSALTLIFVMVISIIMSVSAGNTVSAKSRSNIQDWARNRTSSSARYVAEAFDPMLPTGSIDILVEAVRDRFVGYPDAPGYEDDEHVPFPDALLESGRNRYPLDALPLGLDWQLVPNVNDGNYREHVQHRWPWYEQRRLSTAGAFYSMQGACDPSVVDPGHVNYYDNCTENNNNVSTGGAVRPTRTNEFLHRKAKDLQAFLKPLYEYATLAKSIGVYFANDGAGSSVIFPTYQVDYTKSYISIGCDWMKAGNPLDPKKGPIGTPEMIARCHPAGEVVSNSEFNPLETAWCRDQALNPHRADLSGPHRDTRSGGQAWQLFVGRAVYDRLTSEFIACTLIDVNLFDVEEDGSNVFSGVHTMESTRVTLVNWDDGGTVIISPNWDPASAEVKTTVDDPALALGISSDKFQSMKGLVDFDAAWDPREARDAFEAATFESSDGTKLISFYPVPHIPAEYDPTYRPGLMVILSLEKDEVFSSFRDLDDSVNQAVRNMVIFTLVLGFSGLAIVFAFILIMSLSLTRPLEWMHDVSGRIVQRFGDEGAKDTTNIDVAQENPTFRFSPRTELNSLAEEFQKMLLQFSGNRTAARVVKLGSQLREVRNGFVLLDEFEDLYKSRRDAGFQYNYEDVSKLKASEEDNDGNEETCKRISTLTWDGSLTSGTNTSPSRLHFGPNSHATDGGSRSTFTKMSEKDNKVLRSPLFWWIIRLIVAPLLITAIAISCVVMWNVSTHMSSMDTVVQEEYLQLEESIMGMTSKLRAKQATAQMEFAVRNLHLLTRNAEWVMFGGLNRSDAFPQMTTGAERCKTAESLKCEYYNEADAACDCEWDHPFTEDTCQNYSGILDSRYLQRVYWVGQSQDAFQNGDRNFTSYPKVDTTPNTTAFWDDVMTVPGSERGRSASGHDTTYDRLRAIAALSAINFPIYNSAVGEDKSIGSYYGFEADGMLAGYGGCDGAGFTAEGSFFQSSESNGAARLNSKLCPPGRYGYDTRCRGWHTVGKNIWLENGSPVYITPPYLFSNLVTIAQSCSGPLIDPITGEYVGQASTDFIASAFHTPLSKNTPLSPGGFPILITTEKDIYGVDTVIGPNFSIGDEKAIEDLVVPYDPECIDDVCPDFHKVAEEMRAGETGTTSFSRLTSDGSSETVHISYAPVSVKSFRPVNSTNFSSGVKEFDSLIYSLGIAEPENGLLEPFQDVGRDIQRQANISIAVLAILITLASVLLVYMSYRVTVSITVPIQHLLALIKNVNRLENKEDIVPPDNNMGSSEVLAVYETFSRLCLVLRFANSAFFTGNIETAYRVLVDTLRLFKSLDNKKAIGVASNNLGNCMLAMYRTMEITREPQICGLSKAAIISKGSAYFRDAIKLGEEAYDKFYEEEGWSGNCLVFMQHLSNRYFNCAMFLLTVKKDHTSPDEAERLGLRDLQISSDMDVEIADQCLEVGFRIDKVEHFDLKMSRIRGLLSVMEMSYPDDWDTKGLIDGTFKDLRTAVKNPSSDFFKDISPAGRMQQLDVELIRYARIRNELEEGAKICIRMLVEDEYAFQSAELVAVKALVEYANDLDGVGGPEGIDQQAKNDLEEYQNKLELEMMQTVSRHSGSHENAADSFLSRCSTVKTYSDVTRMRSSVMISMRESTRGDFTMEMF